MERGDSERGCVRVHGRVALVGEYLDGIFSNRAVTCGVEDAWYELLITPSGEAASVASDSIDNRRLVPTILEAVEERWPLKRSYDVRIRQEMPSGAGLGSSAAFGVAIVAGICAVEGITVSRAEIAEIAVDAEKRFGITGGRMDQYSAAFGGANAFRFHDDRPAEVTPMELPSGAMLVIANSGVRRRSGEVIDAVFARVRDGAINVEAFVREGNRVADAMTAVLANGHAELALMGQLINEAHAGLRDGLQVSSDRLDRLIDAALQCGAFGAKISGAGVGGCIFALCDPTTAGSVAERLKSEGAGVQVTRVGGIGVEVRVA